MSTTRRNPPLQVFEDDAGTAYNAAAADQDVESALLNALGPLSDASSKHNQQFKPSTRSRPGSSPSKKDSSPARPMSRHTIIDFKIPPPKEKMFHSNPPTKNGNFYNMNQQVAPKPLYWGYGAPVGKENMDNMMHASGGAGVPYGQHPAYMSSDPHSQHHMSSDIYSHHHMSSEADYSYKGPMKRGMVESAPLKPVVKKQRMSEDGSFDLPNPEDMPSLSDDGTKPPHSYAELIGMAILRAPNRRLTLAQIYKWISDTFQFYKGSEGGWQNSIRHNLSLNKNFIKQERPKDDPGKGNYWAIKPGEERAFLAGKKQPVRKMMNPDGSQYGHGLSLPSDPASFRPSSAPAVSNFTMGPTSSVKRSDTRDIDSAKFPDEADLSSDGTIEASDPALQDEETHIDDSIAMPPPPVHMRSSPPPADLGSSPPMINQHRRDTPPAAQRPPSSSRSAGRRAKFAGVQDSGYWSSIESSAARGATQQLAADSNEIRAHRIKKGRAEAEIARMRSSSFDSPSKHQPQFRGTQNDFSSPVHKENPLTPAVVFKRPARPPPSVSPNTNLRDHRNRVRALMGSPAKTFSPMPDANSWSPAFTLGAEHPVGLTPFISPLKQGQTPWRPLADTPGAYNMTFSNTGFDIFIDAPEELVTRGSPEKRSVRRPSLARAATSTGILADITGSSKSNNPMLTATNGSPFSFSPFLSKPMRAMPTLDSPLKQVHQPGDDSTSDLSWLDANLGGAENFNTINSMSQHEATKNDVSHLFGVDLHSDGSEEGIDLFQNFGKIGSTMMPAPNRANGSPVRRNMGPPARPSMGRSASSRW
ncbi:unnamed protein product [Zymoseptoria tritici ST99CH_1A5]|uniref:Fork-head domain-containing protein n=3 Tax=Zymoseptoria tritici TaxID=1047171 RepID=F9XHJ4_ZYMTI|nr:uncharacterized protein MYCGRDRAFT_110431 [Zymoseptoria tritici IPO323]EGP84992.1 hypothetical protein MYCGRDRAFT_110431 [Zymoseptoria tritici IPO323]SMQ53318.1 unnamed protein product [Zymoseptoria tritici ST99CH_3D7]SMY26949.1 unnamed protein product [Zymoseptoria tritici ST99CH_1A5]